MRAVGVPLDTRNAGQSVVRRDIRVRRAERVSLCVATRMATAVPTRWPMIQIQARAVQQQRDHIRIQAVVKEDWKIQSLMGLRYVVRQEKRHFVLNLKRANAWQEHVVQRRLTEKQYAGAKMR